MKGWNDDYFSWSYIQRFAEENTPDTFLQNRQSFLSTAISLEISFSKIDFSGV